MVQLCIAPTQSNTIYPHQDGPASDSPSAPSALISLFTPFILICHYISLGLCICCIPFHSSLTTITRLFPTTPHSCAITIPAPPTHFHTESITSPRRLFFFIHQFNPSGQIFADCLPLPFELITGFHSHSLTLKPGIITAETLCLCEFKNTEGEGKAIMRPSVDGIFPFIVHTLRQNGPTPTVGLRKCNN